MQENMWDRLRESREHARALVTQPSPDSILHICTYTPLKGPLQLSHDMFQTAHANVFYHNFHSLHSYLKLFHFNQEIPLNFPKSAIKQHSTLSAWSCFFNVCFWHSRDGGTSALALLD